MTKRKTRPNARAIGSATNPDTSPDHSKDAGAQAAATDDKANPPADGGGGGGDGAAGAEEQAVSEEKDKANGSADENQEAAASQKPSDPATAGPVPAVALEASAGDASAENKDGEAQAVNLDQDATRYFGGGAGGAMDPDGNPPSDAVPAGGAMNEDAYLRAVYPVRVFDHISDDILTAAVSAAESLRYLEPIMSPESWVNDFAAFSALAEFFRTFPDSPDESGLVQLERLKIELTEEHRPGLLLAMIRVFRVALDQLDRLDREDAARAEAAKPKPEPEKWREAKGFKQTKKAMQPGSGLKPRR